MFELNLLCLGSFSCSIFGAIGICTIVRLKEVINAMKNLNKGLDDLQNFGKA
jgi:hypothetical protein